MDSNPLSALEVLREIEQRCKSRALNSQHENVDQSLWAGMAFRLSGRKVVAPMNEITEIFNLPTSLTRVPGASPWVKGIANIRGSLLPIMDLQAFLLGKPVVANRRSRVLVINHDDTVTGLLVGDVIGMKHFSAKHRLSSVRVDSAIERLISAAYKDVSGTWPVISIEKLVSDEQLRKAAA